MLAFITSLIGVMKTAQTLVDIGEMFVAQWINYDIGKLGDEAAAIKEEHAVINRKYKESTSDADRRALLRTLNRVR